MAEATAIRPKVEAGSPVPLETYHEVTLFLYREARILDEERYREWFGLLTRDIHYWIPFRENRFRKDKRPEPRPETSANLYNEDYDDLEDRVKRFETGLVWSYAVALQFERPESGRSDMAMGVQYRDHVARTDGGWWVSARQTVKLWTRGQTPG